MAYNTFISQKYSHELEELTKLAKEHNNLLTKYEQVMLHYRCNIYMSEIPIFLFVNGKLLFTAIWRTILNIKYLHENPDIDDYNIKKTMESFAILLNGCTLTEQEMDVIIMIKELPNATATEKFIMNARTAYMINYLRKKLLPYWKDKLTPECIEYVYSEIEKNIKDTNNFIHKEDLLRTVYFVKQRPLTWREQLIDAGIPFDDEEKN